jgi:hypothetical protein
VLRKASDLGLQNSLLNKQQNPRWFKQIQNGADEPPNNKEKEGEGPRCISKRDLTKVRLLVILLFLCLTK